MNGPRKVAAFFMMLSKELSQLCFLANSIVTLIWSRPQREMATKTNTRKAGHNEERLAGPVQLMHIASYRW